MKLGKVESDDTVLLPVKTSTSMHFHIQFVWPNPRRQFRM